ncbi:hypothetical protein T02_6858 [Trichinella nativa]|uniref:Uncharacterized protein n=1 Tax=Trichinella nativa TaxID=6335 RepID=A0A0V1LFU7_9BILA|nr:hypothetical protein T02_6858 [Trichinella nativa]
MHEDSTKPTCICLNARDVNDDQLFIYHFDDTVDLSESVTVSCNRAKLRKHYDLREMFGKN